MGPVTKYPNTKVSCPAVVLPHLLPQDPSALCPLPHLTQLSTLSPAEEMLKGLSSHACFCTVLPAIKPEHILQGKRLPAPRSRQIFQSACSGEHTPVKDWMHSLTLGLRSIQTMKGGTTNAVLHLQRTHTCSQLYERDRDSPAEQQTLLFPNHLSRNNLRAGESTE